MNDEMEDTPEQTGRSVRDILRDSPNVSLNDFSLSEEDAEEISSNEVAMKLFAASVKQITKLKQSIDEKDENLALASQNLESILMSQGAPYQQESVFESKFYAVKRERDDLVLQCVQLQSELESMKTTAAHAIATFSKGKEDGNTSMQSDTPSTPEREDEELEEEKKQSGASLRTSIGSMGDLSSLLEDMTRKMHIENTDVEIEAPLVLEFLQNLYKQKEAERESILSQLQILSNDICKMEKKVNEMKRDAPKKRPKETSPLGKRGRSRMDDDDEDEKSGFKKSKLFDSRFSQDLQSTYFSTRNSSSNADSALQTFSQHLSTFTRFSNLEAVATLGYRPQRNTDIMEARIGAIEFDKEEEFFAVGGELKEVQLFAYCSNDVESGAITKKAAEMEPVQFFPTEGRITGLSWSPHSRGQIAVSDTAGVVSLWDAGSATDLVSFREHDDKKVYAVDYSYNQPGILASASQDATVRLWDVRDPTKSASVITSSTEVCSVRFNLTKDHELACGNKNSIAYVYDTRKLEIPLHVLAEHKGPVCGVAYHKHNQLFTQSTDGTIKLWDFATPAKAVRTFHGHVNTCHFTGIAARKDHIACGSEDNRVVVYNNMITSPILFNSFETGVKEQDASRYGSAVCWNKHANIMLSGNSAGVIKILKLS